MTVFRILFPLEMQNVKYHAYNLLSNSKMYTVIILLSNLLGLLSGSHYFQEIISKTEDLNGKTYIYVNSSMTWNDAKKVCMDLGGDLAKTDRQNIIEIFKDLKEHEWSTLTTDVWVGLIEPVNGTRIWVDCDEWENGDWNNFANDTYSYHHQCYKLRANSDWKWESTLCWEKYQFVCEKNETANCTFRDHLLSYDTVLFDLNETECSLLCINSSDCWAVMWNDTSNTCHHIIVNNASSLSKFKVKICYTGETHIASAPCLEDNSLIPNNSCILPTPSSIIAIDSLSSTYVHPSVSISALEPYQVIYINDIRVAVDGCDFVSLVETTKMCSTATPINVEFSSLTSDPSDMFQTMITIASLSPTMSTVDMASTESYVEPCMCKESITVFSQYLTCSKFKHHASSTVPDVKGLVSNLTVNKKSTGSFQRLLTSAKDNRPEAVAVGTIGIVFIVMVFISILTPDVIGLAIFIKKLYSKHKAKGKEQKRIRKYEQMMTRRLNGPFPDFYPAYSSDVN